MELNHDLVISVVEKIPHKLYKSVYGRLYIFNLSDFVRCLYNVSEMSELAPLCRMVAEELRALGARVVRHKVRTRVYYSITYPHTAYRKKLKKRKKRKTR